MTAQAKLSYAELEQRLLELESRLAESDAELASFKKLAEDNSQKIMDSIPGFAFIKDRELNYVRANRTFCGLLKIPYEQIQGKSDFDIFPDDLARKYIADDQKVLHSGTPIFVEEFTVDLNTDGKRFVVATRKLPWYDEHGVIAGVYGLGFDISELKAAEANLIKAKEKAESLSTHDPLTALPNRTLLFDRLSKSLSRARRNSHSVGLMFLDLDGFKPINDVYGHESGDIVLKSVAGRWLAAIREEDTLARLGGDEFALVLSDLESTDGLETVAAKLIAALTEPLVLPNGESCSLGVSVGISIYPDNAIEMDSLLLAADSAMYECKISGKNSWRLSKALLGPGQDVHHWLKFDSSHLVGVRLIDEQHQQLVRLVNQINRGVMENQSELQIAQMFKDLIEYTVFHFQTEHEYMTKHAYPQTSIHNKEHERLTEHLGHLAATAAQGGELFMLQTIKDWLFHHIQFSDKELGTFLNGVGVR